MRNEFGILGSIVGAALLLLAAVPVVADTHIERELALGPGGRLVVEADGGSVRVAGSSQSGVRVVITSENDDLESVYDLRFEERAGEVEIVARRKKNKDGEGWSLMGLFKGGSRHGLKIEVEAPSETFVAIDTSGGSIEVSSITSGADLDTSGGSIKAHDITGDVRADTSGGAIHIARVHGDVEADTSGGSIHVEEVRGALHADTSGGSIKVVDVTGDLRAGTSGGSIRISEAGGQVTADTSGGSVQVSFAPGNASGGTISASGGSVGVVLDPSVGLEIDAVASGGTVKTELAVTSKGTMSKSQLRGTLGSGGERLRLRTSGGGIRIEAL